MDNRKKVKCNRCQHKWKVRKSDKPLTCAKCKRYDWFKKEQDNEFNYKCKKIRNRAATAIHLAKKKGELKKLSHFPWKSEKIRCVDCNAWAQCYDHRDYSKPLEVVPVCVSCNIKRGSAKITLI